MAKVRAALLGCGGYQGNHVRRLKDNPDAEVVAICDVSLEQAQKMLKERMSDMKPAPEVFTDAAKMYAKVKPDAVFVAIPHTLHYAAGVQALEAGCHVYMEKPMVTDAGEARELAAQVEKSGKVFVVGYNTPCSPEFSFLRRQIRSGKLGKLELVDGHLSQPWKRITTGAWRQSLKLSGGGQAYDSGAHILASLVWSVESEIAEVFAFVDNQGLEVDVNSSINIRFTNGVFASVVISGNCSAGGSFMAFMFENGKIEIDPWSGGWVKFYEGSNQVKYPQVTDPHQTPDDNFIDAILGRAEPRSTPALGVTLSDLMDAIYESARTGQPARPKGS